jgi:hypothetical protein
LRQGKDLAEAENITENLLIALAGVSLEAEKTIKKISILAGQLEKISLSLIMARKKKAAIALRVEYTIYRLVTPKV